MPRDDFLLHKYSGFKEQKTNDADEYNINGHQVILHVEAVELDGIAETRLAADHFRRNYRHPSHTDPEPDPCENLGQGRLEDDLPEVADPSYLH